MIKSGAIYTALSAAHLCSIALFHSFRLEPKFGVHLFARLTAAPDGGPRAVAIIRKPREQMEVEVEDRLLGVDPTRVQYVDACRP